jgi:glycosyltransferase involved in cell wall biosynthesis
VRVLLWIGTLETGGAERQFCVLGDGLLGEGVETVLCTMRPGGSNWDWFAARHADHLVPLHPRAPRGGFDRARQHLEAPVRLRATIRRFRPDVVYSALYLSDAVAWMSTRRTGTPLAWSLRASDAPLNPKRAVPFQFCRAVSRTLPLAIANSHAGRDSHLQRGFRPARFEVVPNGIDTERFAPDSDAREDRRREWGVAPGQPVIGTVGRLDPVKGHDVLLRAARRVVAERPDARFVIVGDGAAPVRERLMRESARLGLEAHVVWAGHSPDPARLYPGFDVFCLPSLSEGFPNVVGEAMATGVGCVVTDVGDAPEIVGPTGRIVPPGDPAALAENLLWAAAQPSDREVAVRRRRIVDAFSITRMVSRTRELLESLPPAPSPR